MLLDIIITHYKEPWSVGKKLFDSIGMQMGISFDDICVYLVHDGTECFPDECFDLYPYKVHQHRIEHGGVSAARNAGFDLGKSQWVIFCDFDDMFSNAFSLNATLPLLSDRHDLLWGDFWSVDREADGSFTITRRGHNFVFVHAKFFRRQYLVESGIRFDTDLEFNEDCLFCTVIMETLPAERIGHIDTLFPIYVWCFTPGSATATQENWWRATIGGYKRNRKVVELFRETKEEIRYNSMIARLIWDAYFSFNLDHIPDDFKPLIEDFRQFYMEHKDRFWSLDTEHMMEVFDISSKQFHKWVEEAEHRWNNIPMKPRSDISIYKWLDGIEKGIY